MKAIFLNQNTISLQQKRKGNPWRYTIEVIEEIIFCIFKVEEYMSCVENKLRIPPVKQDMDIDEGLRQPRDHWQHFYLFCLVPRVRLLPFFLFILLLCCIPNAIARRGVNFLLLV